MRTAILLGATLIAECINKDCVSESIYILSLCMFIFIIADVVDFILNIFKNKYESRKIKNW